MSRSVVGLLAAVGAALSAIVGLAHGELVWALVATAPVATGLATCLALPSNKKTFVPYDLPDRRTCHTGSVKSGRSPSRSDAVGALYRFRETSIVDWRVRGGVSPHLCLAASDFF